VTWYACGSTVYEDAHLGHAKNYVSTDIVRRIMKDYFGFRVGFVMNTTDIDDKIILQGRKQYLLARLSRNMPLRTVGNRILACGAVAFALVRTSAFYIASFCIIGNSSLLHQFHQGRLGERFGFGKD